jgi:hypothetical protein
LFHLAFAQRSAPGTNYKINELREGLSNSIRGARFHWRRMRTSVTQAVAAVAGGNDDNMEDHNENHDYE